MSAKAATTRLNILNKAFDLVYRNGYRTTSVDEIIATTHVTKGAFFYHFKNKDEMGIAMINEVMYPAITGSFPNLLEAEDTKHAIYMMMKTLLFEDPLFDIKYGCPAINLIEELASYAPSFNTALQRLTSEWKKIISESIENGKRSGMIDAGVDSEEAAIFILSGYGGTRNLGKIFGIQAYVAYLAQLRTYLDQL